MTATENENDFQRLNELSLFTNIFVSFAQWSGVWGTRLNEDSKEE